jgi:uncharacterized membrane protein YeaQ/YmgE (transglycosylase-associated protein family)
MRACRRQCSATKGIDAEPGPADGTSLVDWRKVLRGLYFRTFTADWRPGHNKGSVMEAGTAGTVVGVGLGLFVLYVALSGLIVGALARWALPGPDTMGWLPTIGYGLAGSFLGGLLGQLIHLPGWTGLLASVAGAALLIWFFRRRKAPPAPPSTSVK